MNEEKNEHHDEVHKGFKKFSQTPIFSDVKGLFEMIPWVPFIFTTTLVFLIAFLVQIIRMYSIDPESAITYGQLMSIFLLSLTIAIVLGFVVKFFTKVILRNKFKSFGLFGGRMKISINKREKE